jgi:hypothetical protein
MKTSNYTLITALLLQIIICTTGLAQTEKLIKYGTDQSVMFGKFLGESENEATFFIISQTYDASDEGRMIDEAENQKSVVLDYNLVQESISISTEGNYPYSASHLFQISENEYIGVVIKSVDKPEQLPTNGTPVSGTRHCKAIGLAKYNSSTEVLTTFLDPVCNATYILSAFEAEGKVHVAYLNTSNKVEVLSISTDLSPTNRFVLNKTAWYATPSFNYDGFYVYPFNGSNYDECELLHVELDGTENDLSDFMDISVVEQEKTAKLYYDGNEIFAFLSSHDPANNVLKKFALDGEELASESVPMVLYDWKFIDGDILLFLQDEDINNADPITVTSFDNGLSEIHSESYGFPAVKMTDLVVDESSMEFKITGYTAFHYLDSINRDTNKLYYLNDSYTGFLSAEGSAETMDSFYFPNPSDQVKAYLKFSNPDVDLDESVVISFVDLQGKVVKPKFKIVSKNLIEIDTKNLSKGTYVGTAVLEGKVLASGKLVVE